MNTYLLIFGVSYGIIGITLGLKLIPYRPLTRTDQQEQADLSSRD